jgi:predicted nucleic acid-binding protein
VSGRSGGILLDTNIISEVRKGARCHASVAAWYARVPEGDIFLSTLVIGEIRKGIERVRAIDRAKAEALERWLSAVVEGCAQRILPLDTHAAEEWGRMSAIRSVPVIDALLAATAKVNGLTLATRNVAHVQGLGAQVLNPFEVRV